MVLQQKLCCNRISAALGEKRRGGGQPPAFINLAMSLAALIVDVVLLGVEICQSSLAHPWHFLSHWLASNSRTEWAKSNVFRVQTHYYRKWKAGIDPNCIHMNFLFVCAMFRLIWLNRFVDMVRW